MGCGCSTELISQHSPCPPKHSKFFSEYKLGSKLGSGAYGKVYIAIDRDTGKKYAVKIINRARLRPETDKRIREEADILRSIDHPHITRMYDFFDEGNKYYLVMELCEGGEVFHKIVEKRHYTEKEARDLVRILLDAISYCHGRKIIHRDLKPENLLLTSATDVSSIKIADFGYATKLRPHLKERLGTPAYVAPEIVRGHEYDERVDCWSIGVIMYILLGGYPPFDARTQTGMFKKIKAGDFKFHSTRWVKVSSEAKDLISQLLVVNPSKRMTATQALRHPWIGTDASVLSSRDLSRAALDIKYVFNARRKLRAAVGTVMMANRLQSVAMEKSQTGNTPTTSPRRLQQQQEEKHGDVEEMFTSCE